MNNLAFKITNHLLNRKLIKEHVQPTMVEGEIQKVLNEAVGPKVHYQRDNEPLCNMVGYRVKTTENRDNVTCKRCLIMMA